MNMKLVVGIAGAFALSGGVALADTTIIYDDLDADHDGFLSKTEVRTNSGLSSRFSRLDINTDSRLNRSEFSKFESSTEVEAEGGSDVEADIEVEQE